MYRPYVCVSPAGLDAVIVLYLATLLQQMFINRPPIGKRSIVMSVSVCVCLSAIISSELHVRYSAIFCYLWPWLGPLLEA